MDPNGLDGHGWGMWLEFMCGDSHVSIGNSAGSQSKSTTVYMPMLPDDCPARIDKSNWLGGHTYGDFFDVTVGDCPSDDHATGHYDTGGAWHDMAWWNTHETESHTNWDTTWQGNHLGDWHFGGIVPCDCQDPHGFTTQPGCDSIHCDWQSPIFGVATTTWDHYGGNYGGHYHGWAAKGAEDTAATGKKEVRAAESNNKSHKQ